MEQVLQDELLLEEASFMGMRGLQSTPGGQDEVGYIVNRAFDGHPRLDYIHASGQQQCSLFRTKEPRRCRCSGAYLAGVQGT